MILIYQIDLDKLIFQYLLLMETTNDFVTTQFQQFRLIKKDVSS